MTRPLRALALLIPAALLLAACAAEPAAEPTSAPTAADPKRQSIDLKWTTCEDYLEWAPEDQDRWWAKYSVPDAPVTPEQFAELCAGSPDERIQGFYNDALAPWREAFLLEQNPVLALVDEWTDADGYSFRFEARQSSVTHTVDITNAKPGFADITWDISVEGWLTNTTPSRNVQKLPAIVADAAWPSDSVLCQEFRGYHLISTNTPGVDGRFCTITGTSMTFQTQNAFPLSTGNNVTVRAHAGGTVSVSEANLAAVEAALATPDVWAIGRSGVASDCLMENGLWLSKSTAPTGCTAK